jgi:hypothetical protein
VADVLDRLKAALADRYTLERQLGAGGIVNALGRAEGSRTQEDVSGAAAAVSQPADLLEM